RPRLRASRPRRGSSSRRRPRRSHASRSYGAGTVTRRMPASEEKPYRVYRGGRTKGKVPLPSTRERGRGGGDGRDRRTYRSGGGGGGGDREVVRRPRRRWTWRRWTWVTLLALVVLFVIWSVAGYLSVRSGVADANKRLPADTTAVLAHQNSLLISSGTNVLLLGTDHS